MYGPITGYTQAYDLLGGYYKPKVTCSPCTTPTKLPIIIADLYTVGTPASIPVTVFANGLASPWTGPGTRSVHKLYVTSEGTDPLVFGIEAAVVNLLVTGTASFTFDVTPTEAWLFGESVSKVIDVWAFSYDDCDGSYVSDFAQTAVLASGGGGGD